MCNKFIRSILCAAVAITAVVQSANAAVEVWLTSGNQAKLLSSENSLSFLPGSGATGNKIQVDAATSYQTMSGFGASMTDSSAWLIQNEMNPSQRNTLMT